MFRARLRPLPVACCAILLALLPKAISAANLCVNPTGTGGCYSHIQSALKHASPNDVISVGPGSYKENVLVNIPISLIGAGADKTTIDAAGLNNGILVDGLNNPGLSDVTIAGFTITNAQWEGVLLISVSDVTVRDNVMTNNDAAGPVFTGAAQGCPGQPAYEMDETGDCGGALHLIGVANSIISDNYFTANADAILISDETAESHDNLLFHNVAKDNMLDCGIVLASHPPMGSNPPYFAKHHGVDHNTVSENVSDHNGVLVEGAGVGLFSDGAGPGRVSGNLIIHNKLTNNGIGGVSIHSHVGPAYHAPADDFSNNQIIGNYIAGNLGEVGPGDTRTPGRVGININSGGGGSPIIGTVVSQNIITDEDIDIAVNTPATVDIHLNDLRGSGIGVGDVCAFDQATACTGTIDATQNYWGCDDGPGKKGCTTVSGSNIAATPWLKKSVKHDE